MSTLFVYEQAVIVQREAASGVIFDANEHIERLSGCAELPERWSAVLLNIDEMGSNTGPYDDDGDPD